jgi:general stress protein YciG
MANTGKSNPGNFANDRDKASEAGKKGGQASSGSGAGKTPASDRKMPAGDKKSDHNQKGGGGRS